MKWLVIKPLTVFRMYCHICQGIAVDVLSELIALPYSINFRYILSCFFLLKSRICFPQLSRVAHCGCRNILIPLFPLYYLLYGPIIYF